MPSPSSCPVGQITTRDSVFQERQEGQEEEVRKTPREKDEEEGQEVVDEVESCIPDSQNKSENPFIFIIAFGVVHCLASQH